MHPKNSHPLKSILYPYIFILKEGKEIKDDFLDYSLMMLFIHSSETIQSPKIEEVKTIDLVDEPKKTKLPRLNFKFPNRI